MNLKSLNSRAVRKSGNVEKVGGLSEAALKDVVAGRTANFIVGEDTPTRPQPEPVQGPVTPEQCAIHFYYPADATA